MNPYQEGRPAWDDFETPVTGHPRNSSISQGRRYWNQTNNYSSRIAPSNGTAVGQSAGLVESSSKPMGLNTYDVTSDSTSSDLLDLIAKASPDKREQILLLLKGKGDSLGPQSK